MAIDKRVSYEMQGHKKPARNYLGKQKTVKNIPVKWKSGPKAPETELAYITKAEKNLLVKKDLHGSLKNGPNTGPDGIMSLDSQGDYTRDRSPAGRQSSPGGPDRSRISQDKHEDHMRSILTGQKDIGQTSKVSDRTRRGAVSEYVNVRQADGSYKPQYVGSAYKDTGKRGFLSKLFGGANRYGYAPVKGLKSIQTRGTPGQPGFGYYSDDEELGEIKPGWGGRILGGLAGLATGIPFVGGAIGSAFDKGKSIFGKKPRDMSQYNELSLTPYNERKISLQNDMPMASINRWTQPINQNVDFGNTVGPFPNQTYADQTKNLLPIPRVTAGENEFINWDQGAKDGGRIGYRNGEFVDENINVEGPNFDFNENIEMAEGKSPFEIRIDELMDTGMSWQEAYQIASEEFGQIAQGESDQGIASIV